MSRAIQIVSADLGIDIREFTVHGISHEGLFAHKWYLGIDAEGLRSLEIKGKLDEALKMLNDDYAVEREAALKEVFVVILPNQVFYDFLKFKGKEGGQHKFPRVLNRMTKDWECYLESRNLGM
jgi:hypothetical protein